MRRRDRFRHWLAEKVLGPHYEDFDGCWCERRDVPLPDGPLDISAAIELQREFNQEFATLLAMTEREVPEITYRWMEDELEPIRKDA